MKGRSNWITEDIHDAGNGRGSSLLEEPLLVLRHRTRTWNGTRRSQQPFRVQSSAAVSPVMRKKELLPGHRWIVFFKRVNRRKRNLCHQHQAWLKLQLALHLLLLTTLWLYHLPLPLPLPASNSSCLLTQCQPLYARGCCTVLFKALYCKIKNVFFIFLYFFNVLCEKYRPMTIQYYIANCVCWVPRVILLDLQTNWDYERTVRTELISM